MTIIEGFVVKLQCVHREAVGNDHLTIKLEHKVIWVASVERSASREKLCAPTAVVYYLSLPILLFVDVFRLSIVVKAV